MQSPTASQQKYVTWDLLTSELNTITGRNYSSKNVHTLHKGLSLDGKLPYSISEYEFNYMRDFILRHNLKNGFELATGIGISTLALGFAAEQLDGKLLSLDSYQEETEQEQPIGNAVKQLVPEKPPGFITNQTILDAYGLKKTILLKGWSPIDAQQNIEKHFGTHSLDYVFLDCPKSTPDFRRDATFLPEFLSKQFAIFVHDTHCYRNQFIALSQEIFGIQPIFLTDFNFEHGSYTQHFPLALITNIKP